MTETDIDIPRHRRIGIAPVASRAVPSVRERSASITLPIFIVSLVIPIRFYAGSVLLSPYRVILIATFIPCIIAWILGRAGRIQSTDILILLMALWGALAFGVVNGQAVLIQTGGIFLLETFGAYLLARCLIRDRSSFKRMVQLLFFMVLFILPFALLENFTGRAFIIDSLGQVFTTFPMANIEPRWGLHRAQGVFEHPILFGVVCSAVFGLTTYVIGKWSRSALVAIAVASSLSAGAYLSLVVQVVLIMWNHVTRGVQHRWGILGFLFAAAFFVVNFLSHRSAFEVFVTYFTFNGDYDRVLMWVYGSQEVLRHPVFGIGLNDWSRPQWMDNGSIDNFWLGTAMQSGLIVVSLLASAVLSVFIRLSRLKNLSGNVKSCRTGLLISLTGVVMAVFTVYLWKASLCLFMFLLGSGLWMVEAPKVAQTPAALIRKPAPYVRYPR